MIAACYNVYNDAAALRGSLELAAPYFDNIYVIHSGPDGCLSNDGTIELLEDFGINPVFMDLREGFGVIRSRLIRECGEDWAFIMDADERFFPSIPVMRCGGTERYPAQPKPSLTVTKYPELVAPGHYLRDLIHRKDIDAVKTIRRHWFDFSMTRPAENWEIIKDWQMRIVRNTPRIGYLPGVKMHERLCYLDTREEPKHATAHDQGGPFHDHFHLFYRQAQPGKKENNEANYLRLEQGEPFTP